MNSVIRNESGEPFSKWAPAVKFDYVMRQNYPDFHAQMRLEYKFCDDRLWRLDFVWLKPVKVAVEIDGFGYGHLAARNIENAQEKRNAATSMGWRVFTYTSRWLGKYDRVVEAVDQVALAVCEKGPA